MLTWQYKTILFEFRKDGLLGDKYIDDDEMEDVLNEQGRNSWELVSVSPVQEGLLSFFKREIQELHKSSMARSEEPAGVLAQEGTLQDPAGSQESPARSKTIPASVQNKVDKPDLKPDAVGGIKIS